MGRRAILAMVLLGSLIAAGQIWLLSAILSRPFPSGRTGWERVKVATVGAKERDPDMSLLEVVSVNYRCNDRIFRYGQPGDTITLNLLSTIPDHPSDMLDGVVQIYTGETWAGFETTAIALVSIGGSSLPTEVTFDITAGFFHFLYGPIQSGNYELYFRWVDYTTSETQITPLGVFLRIDNDTLPSFLGPYVGPDDCGPPVTVQVSTEIHHATSWSYQLYDGYTPISGGSPGAGTHELDGCSGYAHVTDIPSNATRITFTATNGNGSSTVSSNLGLPPTGISIEADPPSIFEGQETTLNWSATYASIVQIDNGIGVVGHTPNPWINELSGSVAVSPMETTTYTITAFGFCHEVTSQVTVTVSPPPTRHNLGPNPGEGTAWYLVPEPCD